MELTETTTAHFILLALLFSLPALFAILLRASTENQVKVHKVSKTSLLNFFFSCLSKREMSVSLFTKYSNRSLKENSWTKHNFYCNII